MRITATHLEQWADSRETEGHLPLLVRRLLQATVQTRQLVMPAGDSVSAPGFDGMSDAPEGNAWVPTGPACWEVSRRSDIRTKAQDDLDKRVRDHPFDWRQQRVFVFVTPRRWRDKERWRAQADQQGYWRGVRVLDADDLEAWLESAPAVSLWLGELLGLTGAGVEAVTHNWERWRSQSSLPLTPEALLADRSPAAQVLDTALAQRPPLITVQADSQEEAVAFVAMRLLALGLADVAACVTDAAGWRFVDSNPGLYIGIAASAEVAGQRAVRPDFTLVVPQSNGEHPPDQARRVADTAPVNVVLQRPDIQTFEAQLIALGEEASDAARLARSTGRSWSVYRRLRAANPAIRHPAWLTQAPVRALVTLMLVGTWDGGKAGDRACIEAVSGRPYDELEADLLVLLRVDDSPVLHIGSVWRAKSARELVHVCAPQMTQAELDRFLQTAESILTQPDPALELPNEQRWMAAVYDKVRQESGLVLDALADSLVKLSVYAERQGSTQAEAMRHGITALVRRLLHGADGERWLSLSGLLRELAEAAPEEFLSAVEHSLRQPDAPVCRLIAETGGIGMTGRCWHAGLLWALELLAWAPERLSRVASILARLTQTPLAGNWGNTPGKSLHSLFRPWWSQTTATSERQLAVLDRLIRQDNEVAWGLLYGLIPQGPMMVMANAAPQWRDDDAGKDSRRSTLDLRYYGALGQRAINQASDRPSRLAQLVERLDCFQGGDQDELIRRIEMATVFNDDDRMRVRNALCKYLSSHSQFSQYAEVAGRRVAVRLRPCFDLLAPVDVVKRYLWLFTEHWVDLPDGREGEYAQHEALVKQQRTAALADIFQLLGWPGLSRLAQEAKAQWLVGWYIGTNYQNDSGLQPWLTTRRAASSSRESADPVLQGVLQVLAPEQRGQLLSDITGPLHTAGQTEELTWWLLQAPFDSVTWQQADSYGTDIHQRYWATVTPGSCSTQHAPAVVDRLTRMGRSRTAFLMVEYEPTAIAPHTLKLLLDAIRQGAEPDGPLSSGWHIARAIEALQASGEIPRRELALLEFGFYEALRYEGGARNLMAELLSDPALFIECLCLVYNPTQGEPRNLDESQQAAARVGWSVLHNGRGIPGADADGSIDPDAFWAWIDTVRTQATACDRAAIADVTVGGWLSACKADADGHWPPAPVRDLLDRDDAEDIRDGFSCGLHNNRGVTSRGMLDGGAQERALADDYRARAQAVADDYPHLATLLNRVAEGYERDARREDDTANLRRESP